MNRNWILGVTVLIAALVSPGFSRTAFADAAEIVFSAAERTIIAHYYGAGDAGKGDKGKKGGRGQGAGSQGLPPGLAKKGQLPPGIAKRQLPSDLARQLPPPPKGFERVIVDNDMLLIEVATQIVHDVLSDVVRNR